MQSKIYAWLVTLVGVLLILPLIGVPQLDSISPWLIALAILVIGIVGIVKGQKKGKR